MLMWFLRLANGQLMMGAEFCYDAIANPKNYDMLRISNKSNTYTSDNHYALL